MILVSCYFYLFFLVRRFIISIITNKAAHDLAQAAIKQLINQVYIEEISKHICDIV